jgi:hypothetical protein
VLEISTLRIFCENDGIFFARIGRDKPNNMRVADSLQKGDLVADGLDVGFLSRYQGTSSPKMPIFLAATTVRFVLWVAL